jgi:hypothetical protein
LGSESRREASGQHVSRHADRVRVLRSLAVTFGAAFVLKFIVLGALSDPAGGRMTRLLQVLFEGVTLDTVTQNAQHPAAGYVAFVAIVMFLAGLAPLPSAATDVSTSRATSSATPDHPAGARKNASIAWRWWTWRSVSARGNGERIDAGRTPVNRWARTRSRSER